MTQDSSAPRISFALAFHNHQPVGNFGWVFEDVYRAAYRPMVDLLLRHDHVRCGLHYTGPLLQWLAREHPEFLDDVRALVDRGQVEILGGGYYEPVLVSLPDADRVGQLRRMADELERLFGVRPRGAWLAERVWEPSLPTALVDGGYAWTIVDDVHLRAAAIPDEEHWGTYTTDDQGRRLTIFPTEQGLRYLIPFQPVADVIEHLRTHASADGTRLGTMGDDGEKFGAWPTTWEHCWGRGQWMEQFASALEENGDWLTTVRPSDWTAAHPPVGRVYIPTSSYVEMTEWALPPDDALLFEHVLQDARARDAPEAKFLRGGFWRNFQRRYREINDLHKQMLRASAAVAAMPPGPVRDRAADHLYQGQSNDCYWHGLFGGIYIAHMRLASFVHLIAAEDLAAGASSHASGRLADVDIDGIDEVLFESAGQTVAVKLDGGAGISEWDARAPRHALAAVLRRRPEASHERLLEAAQSGRLKVVDPEAVERAAEDGAADVGGGAVESIHELVQAKEPRLEARLFYDAYERRSALVHLWAADVTATQLLEGTADERADILDSPYALVDLADDRLVVTRDATATTGDAPQAIRVSKTFRLAGDRRAPRLTVSVRLENRSDRVVAGRFGVEWNLMFLGGGHNPAAFYQVDGERRPHDESGEVSGLSRILNGNTQVGLVLTSDVAPPADAWWYPIETISNSESGFERVYQGSSLVFSWPVELAAGEHLEVEVRHALDATRDHAAEEAEAGASAESA
jgi:alpha-amylase